MSFTRKILGIIAYRKDFLLELNKLPPAPIEQVEFIEQMRIIENGFNLESVPVSQSLPSVNEPQEADVVLEYINKNTEQRELLESISNLKMLHE
jgi:3-deoxy-manno-octulosonate cytidylyltransferase (CMP-KDO synthetase)